MLGSGLKLVETLDSELLWDPKNLELDYLDLTRKERGPTDTTLGAVFGVFDLESLVNVGWRRGYVHPREAPECPMWPYFLAVAWQGFRGLYTIFSTLSRKSTR